MGTEPEVTSRGIISLFFVTEEMISLFVVIVKD